MNYVVERSGFFMYANFIDNISLTTMEKEYVNKPIKIAVETLYKQYKKDAKKKSK